MFIKPLNKGIANMYYRHRIVFGGDKMQQEPEENRPDHELTRSEHRFSSQKPVVQACNTFSVTLEFHAKKIVIHHSLN